MRLTRVLTPRALILGGFLFLACGTAPLLAQTQPDTAAPAAQSAPAPADAGAAPAADAASTTQVDNPYGLQSLWRSGDAVARTTLAILAIMSIATWYVMITKFFQQLALAARGRSAHKNFWTSPSVAEGAAKLGQKSVYGYIADAGVKAANHLEGGLAQKVDAGTWITLSLDRAMAAVNSRLQGGLAVLATVGSIAPFVGLFGTVWGIYHALTAIGIAGQASIDKVAGPVGEALIMTAIGLATAVPAVLGYNFLIRRNKAIMEQVRGFTADVYAALLSGRRIGDMVPGRSPLQAAAE